MGHSANPAPAYPRDLPRQMEYPYGHEDEEVAVMTATAGLCWNHLYPADQPSLGSNRLGNNLLHLPTPLRFGQSAVPKRRGRISPPAGWRVERI